MQFFKTIFDYIFPPPANCLLCGSAMFSGERICRSCRDEITGCEKSFCPLCGRYRLRESVAETDVCGECSERRPVFAAARSVGIYGGMLRDAIYLYKYQGYRSLAEDFGIMLTDLFMKASILPGATVLVPVPLSREKLELRGFNQSELMARKMSYVLGLPVRNYLTKGISTPSQSKLKREARINSVQGVFALNDSPAGEQVVLIDDILTTGATAGECSRVLLQGGVRTVAVLTLASGVLEKRLRGSMAREEKVGICRNQYK